jgi:hypothetical protein
MIVIGGHDGQKHLNDFYQFDFDNETWSSIEIGEAAFNAIESTTDGSSVEIGEDYNIILAI